MRYCATCFDGAVTLGHRPEAAGNPCTGIVRYRRPPRGRLRDADDLARLGAVLRLREDENPVCVAAARLLLLTGCRPGEIRCLHWSEVKADRLALIDAKTGPRHVLLGEAARELLDGLAETASGECVFPGKDGDEPMDKNVLYWFWVRTRDAVAIMADARLHDLRHAHTSHAVMNGERLHVAGRLLGHRRASMTNRNVHLDDATLSQAAERVTVGNSPEAMRYFTVQCGRQAGGTARSSYVLPTARKGSPRASMMDTRTPEQRRRMMHALKSKTTKPPGSPFSTHRVRPE